MRKLLTLILSLLTLLTAASASEPANPADPAMVAALLPGFTLIEGIDDGDELRLLMRCPNDALIFVGGLKAADGAWRFTQSAPLPEGTILGVENFTHSLGIPNTYYDIVSLQPYADGTWGVSLIYPQDSGLFLLGQHYVEHGWDIIDGQFGDHPWSDITRIDWTTLPRSLEEAIAAVDPSNWAVVCNPNPEDRLHLRVSPDQDAASLGKYYNRTPVRILKYGDAWCAVAIGSTEGWMMTKYLAFGADMADVRYSGPWLTGKEEQTRFWLSHRPDAPGELRRLGQFYVLGMLSDDWYHIWLPETEAYGYVRQDDLWPGNG